jgi:hypothetical protein
MNCRYELSLGRAPDGAILTVATAAERAIIIADLDFPGLFSQLNASGSGMILLGAQL